MLPQSLECLSLTYNQAAIRATDPNKAKQPIAPGVLPSQLQRLEIAWSRSLADLALPASLTQLDLLLPADLLMPAGSLPNGLQTLLLSCEEFDPRHLIRALPSGLRMLRLRCLTLGLTFQLCAMMSQLEELDLDPPSWTGTRSSC